MAKRLTCCALAASALLALSGCTGYRNAQQCKNQMIAAYPKTAPPMTIERSKIAGQGSRVVIEATYKVEVKIPQKTLLEISKADVPAAAECTFDGETLKTFTWLVPKFGAKGSPVPEED